jgi:hypothetical protein
MPHPNSQVAIVPNGRWPVLRAWFLTQGFEIGEGAPLGPSASGPITHRAFHSWMTDALISAADADAPRPWQVDVAADGDGQSNKQLRYSSLRGTLTPVGDTGSPGATLATARLSSPAT